MRLLQIILASTGNDGDEAPAQVLAATPGVSDELIGQVGKRCPGRQGLLKGSSKAVSYFPVTEEQAAISRSVIGPESFTNGQKQIITKILLVSRSQLAGYHFNPALMLHTIQSDGRFVFEFGVDVELDPLDVADKAAMDFGARKVAESEIDELQQAIRLHGQIGIVGIERPLSSFASVLNKLPVEERLRISFALGLDPATNPNYHVHLFAENNRNLSGLLSDAKVRRVMSPV